MEKVERKKLVNSPAIRRFPIYLHILKRLARTGIEYVSTTELINRLEFEAVLIRKDLSGLGLSGVPRRGYRINELIRSIEDFLGWSDSTEAFLVGVGALGQALLGYDEFSDKNFNIIAAFDADEKKCGRPVHGKQILHVSKLADLAERMNIKVAILCVPWFQAQEVADQLVEAGIKAIWNFSPQELDLPADVICHNENLMSSLAVFSVKMREWANHE